MKYESKPKIIQLIVTPVAVNKTYPILYALCSDGSVLWRNVSDASPGWLIESTPEEVQALIEEAQYE